jgi:hypothetical protein
VREFYERQIRRYDVNRRTPRKRKKPRGIRDHARIKVDPAAAEAALAMWEA